jgi:hypothetical protein
VDDFPFISFGRAESDDSKLIDWRNEPDPSGADDDEELKTTPPDVVAMLGFDPLDEDNDEPLDKTFNPDEPRDDHGRWSASGDESRQFRVPQGYSNRFTQGQKDAIYQYTRDGAKRVNYLLREKLYNRNLMEPGVHKIIAGLDESFRSPAAVITNDMYVSRGLGQEDGTVESWKEGLSAGKTVELTDLGYSSTSTSNTRAEQFAVRVPDEQEAIVADIYVPKGSRALSLSDAGKVYRGGGDEKEVLLPRGSRFKVEGVSKGTAHLTDFQGEVISKPVTFVKLRLLGDRK